MVPASNSATNASKSSPVTNPSPSKSETQNSHSSGMPLPLTSRLVPEAMSSESKMPFPLQSPSPV